jgi:Family of unknown function (DUF6510)
MEPLDGNALAGALETAFGRDMTTVLGTCASCGQTNHLAALRVYLRAPGRVARCASCGEIQLVLLERRGVVCVDASGVTLLSDARANR